MARKKVNEDGLDPEADRPAGGVLADELRTLHRTAFMEMCKRQHNPREPDPHAGSSIANTLTRATTMVPSATSLTLAARSAARAVAPGLSLGTR